MTEQDVVGRLRMLSDSDGEGLWRLAGDIGTHCRGGARVVLDAWINGPPDRQTPCAFICSNLKELPVQELLARADAVAPERRVHFLEMVAAQQLRAREQILTTLEPLLKDPSPAGGAYRTCDAAYLLIRRLVRLAAGEAAEFSTEGGFLSLGPEEKDKEIQRFKRSAAWQGIFPG
jgi:hypothetical protein